MRLTAPQQRTLEALCRRIAPAAEAAGHGSTLAFAVALRMDDFSAYNRARVIQAINVIGGPALPLVLLGRPATFAALPAELQDRLLARCENSRVFLLRLLFAALKRLIHPDARFYATQEGADSVTVRVTDRDQFVAADCGEQQYLAGRRPAFKMRHLIDRKLLLAASVAVEDADRLERLLPEIDMHDAVLAEQPGEVVPSVRRDIRIVG